MEDFLRVGVITQTHGLKGEVKVFPTTDDVNRFRKLKNAYIKKKKKKVSVTINRVSFFKQYVILSFKEYTDINEVEKYKKCDLLVTREDALPLADNEYYICDLIGCSVISDTDEEIGTLTDVLQTGANDVYVVKTADNKELLLPVIDECILDVDIDQKIIKAHIMKGLLDL